MNKKRLTFLAVLMAIVLTVSLGLFVACNKDNTDEKKDPLTATKGLLIPNGDFKLLSTATEEFPRSITDWTGGKMYSSGSFDGDVVAGAVNMEPKNYNDNKKKWNAKNNDIYNLLTANGKYTDDEIKNTLMIYMPEKGTDLGVKDAKYGPTAYGYTSKNFTIDKQSYYKLTVDVLTYNIAGTKDKDGKPDNEADMGARIYLSSNTYQEYSAIDTKGAWETYTFYVEGAANASTTLTLMLGLGKYTTYFTGGLTTGYAFFDNVALTKLEDTKEDTGIKQGDLINELLQQVKAVDKTLEIPTDPAVPVQMTARQQFIYKEFEELYQRPLFKEEPPKEEPPAEEKADGQETATPPAIDEDAKPKEYVRTASLRVPNGRFDFGSSSISSSSVPFNWTSASGSSGNDDPAPTSLGTNGIIDVSKFDENYQKYAGSYYTKEGTIVYPADLLIKDNIVKNALNAFGTERIGKNLYMLSQQLMTAQGIKSSKPIVVERGKFYTVTVEMYTFNMSGAGVSLILTGKDGGKDIIIEGISSNKMDLDKDKNGILDSNTPYRDDGATNNGLTTYTFCLKGNQFRDYSYNVEFWLGTGGTNDNDALKYTKYTSSSSSPTENGATTYNANGTFSSGWAFFDELKLNEVDSGVYLGNGLDATKINEDRDVFVVDNSAGNTPNGIKVDLSSTNLFDKNGKTGISGDFSGAAETGSLYDNDTNGTPTGFVHYTPDPDNNKTPVLSPEFITAGGVDIGVSENNNNYFKNLGTKHPGVPYDIANKQALMMYASKNGFYEFETIPFIINPNTFYRISLWVKTVDVQATSGMDVSLMSQLGAEKSKKDDTAVASFTKINTKEFDEYTNDWCELTCLVRGGATKSSTVYLKIALGSGDIWSTTALAKGAGFATNMSLTETTSTEFSGASTGTYVKSHNFTTKGSDTGNFTNGNFNQFDVDKTKGMVDGVMNSKAGVPLNWTISDNKAEKDENFVGGIIKLKDENTKDENGDWTLRNFKNSTQTNTLFNNNTLFDNLYSSDKISNEKLAAIGGPNLLALAGLNSNKYAIGYASDKFTLSANTVYKISVWVYNNGAKGMLYLGGETLGTTDFEETPYILIDHTGWAKYTFNVEIGLSSVSMKLNMWLGENLELTLPGVDNPTADQKEKAKSNGMLLFDNVNQETSKTAKEDFDKIDGKVNYERKISYLSEGFDMFGKSDVDKKELNDPSNWTGSEDTEQKRDDSKHGVIFAKDGFIESDKGSAGGSYVNILGGEDIKDDDKRLEIGTVELEVEFLAHGHDNEFDDIWDDNSLTEENKEAKIKVELLKRMKAQRLDKMQRAGWMPMDFINGHANSGDSMLIINNLVDSAYYYSSPSYKLSAETYYEISVYVRTFFGVDENGNPRENIVDEDGKPTEVLEKQGAFIELYLGSANESGSPLIFTGIKTTNKKYVAGSGGNVADSSKWQQYKFYISTLADDVTSVKLKLGLGKYYSDEAKRALTSGYAMFDDIKFDAIDKETFDAIKEGTADEDGIVRTLKREITADSTTGDTSEETKPETDDGSKFNLDTLWWMIPTILLGAITIIVVAVFAFRKIKRPKRVTVVVEETKFTSETLEEKHSRYDDFIE